MNKEIEETIKHCKHLCQQEKKKEREELLKKIEGIINKSRAIEERYGIGVREQTARGQALEDIKKLIK